MDEVRWGILGTGYVAGQFAEGLRHARGARLQAVASRGRDNAVAFAAENGSGVTAHGSYEALIADPAVDVIYVATPNEYHLDHCLQVIAAGKHLLCEKPFAMDAAQARQIIDAAQARGVFCMEGMWMRCSPALQQVIAAVKRGAIGEPRLLTAQLGTSNLQSPGHRLFEPPAGGALLDMGVYAVSMAQAFFGTPTRIQASALIGPTGVDDQVSVLLEYAGGKQAVIQSSIRCQLNNNASLHGTGGLIRIDTPLYFPESYTLTPTQPHALGGRATAPGLKQRLVQNPALQPLIAVARKLRPAKSKTETVPPHGTGMTAEIEEVGRCLKAGLKESPLMTHSDTIAVLETLDTVRRTWLHS